MPEPVVSVGSAGTVVAPLFAAVEAGAFKAPVVSLARLAPLGRAKADAVFGTFNAVIGVCNPYESTRLVSRVTSGSRQNKRR